MAAMPTPAIGVPNPSNTLSLGKGGGTSTAPGSGIQPIGSQLYAGMTNPNAMPVPMSAPAPVSTATAPSGLSVNQNPGTGGTAPTNPTGNDPRTQQRLQSENQQYFGEGVGNTLTNYLNTGAGYNGPLAQQAIKSTTDAMQQQINQQYGGLQTSLANAGISPNSSAAALASGEFLSNASAQENAIAAQQYTQMYSQSQQDYLSALQMIAGVNNVGTMNQRTALGSIGSFLTGGVGGLLQYQGGAAGTAGNVTMNNGILGSGGSTAGFEGGANTAQSALGLLF